MLVKARFRKSGWIKRVTGRIHRRARVAAAQCRWLDNRRSNPDWLRPSYTLPNGCLTVGRQKAEVAERIAGRVGLAAAVQNREPARLRPPIVR